MPSPYFSRILMHRGQMEGQIFGLAKMLATLVAFRTPTGAQALIYRLIRRNNDHRWFCRRCCWRSAGVVIIIVIDRIIIFRFEFDRRRKSGVGTKVQQRWRWDRFFRHVGAATKAVQQSIEIKRHWQQIAGQIWEQSLAWHFCWRCNLRVGFLTA